MRSVRFGLIGTGMAGLTHARELRFVRNAELIAVASRREDQVRQFAYDYEVKHWYTDYRELLSNKDVDVVCVLVPTGLHAEVAIAASEAGKHVLVEKPLFASRQSTRVPFIQILPVSVKAIR